jgi:hypothetical protein
METGIRRYAQQQDIFKSSNSLREYFLNEDNIPNKRLEKIIEVLRYKDWLITKTIPEIAEACGIKYHEPSTKEEVAAYMTYLTSYTEKPHTFFVADVGDTPEGNTTLQEMYDNMMVANINIKFSPSEFLKYQDFLHYADRYEIVLVVLNDKTKHWDFAKELYGEEPEVILYGFLEGGEKYITLVPKVLAEKIVNEDLKNATLAVKWGGYNPKTNKSIWSESLRLPDLVIYNTPIQLKTTLEALKKTHPDTKFQHLHAGAMEGHPFQSLLVRIGDFMPIHVVNHFGNKNILNALDVIRNNTTVINNTFLMENKKTLNNLMALWMGLFWEVDWVETMIDKKTLHFRK